MQRALGEQGDVRARPSARGRMHKLQEGGWSCVSRARARRRNPAGRTGSRRGPVRTELVEVQCAGHQGSLRQAQGDRKYKLSPNGWVESGGQVRHPRPCSRSPVEGPVHRAPGASTSSARTGGWRPGRPKAAESTCRAGIYNTQPENDPRLGSCGWGMPTAIHMAGSSLPVCTPPRRVCVGVSSKCAR